MPILRFDPDAEAEILAAQKWYDHRRPGLGAQFLAELDHVLEVIRSGEITWPIWPKTPARLGIRRALLHGFPYGVAYTRETDSAATVLAVPHLRRRPRYWLERAGRH